jgi:hypothetical protein
VAARNLEIGEETRVDGSKEEEEGRRPEPMGVPRKVVEVDEGSLVGDTILLVDGWDDSEEDGRSVDSTGLSGVVKVGG